MSDPPEVPGAWLDAAVAAAEVEIYLTTAGIAERAAELEAAALEHGLESRARRARLVGSDALSRRGGMEEALRIQLEVLGEAERSGDRLICARAQCLLASTYDRLADVAQSQAAAAAAVHLLEPEDPPAWHAEHMMVLALFTSFRRRGAPDFTTFEEALRLARAQGDPLLLLAVLNNYAFVALEASDPRGVSLAEELRQLLDAELGDRAPSPWLDTVAMGMLAAGRLDEAFELIEKTISMADSELLEPDALPAYLMRAAEIHRARGERDRARERMLEARRLSEGGKAPDQAAQALRGLSELAAEEGDHQSAYRLLKQHIEEWAHFQTERSESHAATIQAIYGAEVERRRRLAVEQLADTDPLTGLWNRRYLDRRLPELASAPLAVALLDLDHFKQVNDRYSHDAGDAVLLRSSELLVLHLEDHLEAGAFAARLGGEEFVIVLPGTDYEAARRRCERIRTHVQASDWSAVAPGLHLSISIGVVVAENGGAVPSELLSRADAALYEAKRGGRDRVVVKRYP